MGQSFTERISRFIDGNGLLEQGAQVVVGLSGGADSTALLKVLTSLGYRCTAVHCNFRLRGVESDRDQQFCTDLCKSLGIPLIICSYDTKAYAAEHGISIEMAARELRYADFERIRKETGASAICIAHHRDDSVETLLLNLIRGTGLKGLTGIKPINGHIVRPMLCVSRQDIESWLGETGQSYITDSTNLETDYTRNKIRLQLLPIMRCINPGADNSLEQTAMHLQQAYALYSQAVEQALSQVTAQKGNTLTVSIDSLKQSVSPKGLLFEILSPLGFNDSQITSIARSFDSQPGITFCSSTHRLIKERDSFIISPIETPDFKSVTIDIKPGSEATLPDGRTLTVTSAPAGTPISTQPDTATFDAALLGNGPITIRTWREGDRLVPFGMKGSKLVSDLLTDCKVSATARPRQLVATFNNEIIWVVGLRSSNLFRVTEHTTTQLILTIR